MTTFKRRLTREKVLQALYAYELSKEPIVAIMKSVLVDIQSDDEDFVFAEKLIHEVIRHQDEIETIIKEKVAHWEFNRIAVIDRMLLRMGICELLYFEDIPPKVTINESIEVAKTFSTEKSGKFINGILDAVLSDLKAGHHLKKTGRGLIDQTIHHETTPSKSKKSTKGK